MQIIFIVPSISDSHYRNRIVEFIDKGYTVNVYGFERKNSNKKPNLPYNISILGSIADKNYTQRIKLYIKNFKYFNIKITKKISSLCVYELIFNTLDNR